MNLAPLSISLERMEKEIWDLMAAVKQRYDFTNIQLDDVLETLFNLQSAISTAREYIDTLNEQLTELEAIYEARTYLDAEPMDITQERGYVRW